MVIETFDPKETYDLGVKMGEQARAGTGNLLKTVTWVWEKLCLLRGLQPVLASQACKQPYIYHCAAV